jgi:hypothetical protein
MLCPWQASWMAGLTGQTLQNPPATCSCALTVNRLSAPSRRGRPKRLACKQPAATTVNVEGVAQQLPSCSERAAVYVAPGMFPSLANPMVDPSTVGRTAAQVTRHLQGR